MNFYAHREAPKILLQQGWVQFCILAMAFYPMKSSVLIIDDEKNLRNLLARILELEGYIVFQAGTGKEGLKILAQEDILVIFSDVKLPDLNGVELILELKRKKSFVEVIQLTAFGTISDGVKAMKNGAFDYITKGDDNDKILPLLSKALEKASLQFRVFQLENQIVKRFSFESILGKSKAIKGAIELAKKVAGTDATVLILGETGTGKEIFSQSIHYFSGRREKSFVALNCSAFGKDLLENELFGHKAGSFTGASHDTKGLFEEADKGTLFLDEIGEMSTDLQAKLLRVLENGEFIKIGDTKTQKINVRVIAATHRNLEERVEMGEFREDLYYRLGGFKINLPSLNHRPEDIPLLTAHYLREFALKTNSKITQIDPQFIKALEAHHWKGNIRELKNLVERAVIICESDTLTPDLLPFDFFLQTNQPGSDFSLSRLERNHILKILLYTKGNKTETAQLLDIGLTTLYRKIEEYKLG